MKQLSSQTYLNSSSHSWKRKEKKKRSLYYNAVEERAEKWNEREREREGMRGRESETIY